jgi:virulence-associated protein E
MNSELTEPLSVCGIYNGPAQDPSSYIGCIRNYARGSEAFDGDDLLGMFADEDAAAKAFYTYWDKKFGSNGSSAGPQPEAPIEEAIEQPPKGDGRVEAGTVLGSIESRGEFGFEAFGPDKVSLGLFPDRLAAKAALGNPQPSEEQLRLPAVTFLEDLRPGGPWVLTAIVPDSTTTPTTVTAHTPDDVEAFVREHNGKAGLYYSVNPTRTALSKKAAKTNITAIEYVLGDLDPAAIETSEAAKARYLEQLNGGFEPKPTAAIDSGNGIQGLWRLKERIVLGEPINGKFSAEDQAKIDDVEARAANVMRRLGSKAGTQNIDRILRLPGTTNLPNAKKRKEGRVACQTKLLWFDDTSYPLDAFPKEEPGKKKPGKKKAAGRDADALEQAISKSAPKGERSEAVWFVVNEMLRRGHRAEAIVQVLLDRDNGISEHVYDQSEPHEYAARQVEQAIEKIEFICNDKGNILPTVPANIRIALLKLGVSVRYDRFADRSLLDGLPGYGPALEDAAVYRLWLQFSERLHFYPNLELVRIVMDDTARLNGFHPVCDYLDALQWDGVPRVDKWLTTYARAEDSRYTRAVGALMLIAAVRRVRKPGCKFDEMLILEQPQQGTEKSSALAVLAVQEDWFSDDLPLNVEGKRVIEMLRGRWIVEAAELSGMRKADIGHLNALLSRRVDRARMAWGRLPIEAPRQCIITGTTNKSEYLRDTTGNRRYWPVLIVQFNLDALRRDRDQLWAEAAAREAKGESIRLARELWPEAAKEQRQRLADDPFVEVLRNHLGHLEGKIKAADVWEILNLHGAQLTQDAYARAAEAMKRIGWKRPNTAGTARFDGRLMAAYMRGDSQTVITVSRGTYGLHIGKEGAPA